MKTTLFPVCCSNFGVSTTKTSFGAPPLITLISLADTDMLVTMRAENAISPEILFIGLLRLEFECFKRPRMEHFFHLHQPRRQALRMMMTQKGLKRLAIRRSAVRPEVLAHQGA